MNQDVKIDNSGVKCIVNSRPDRRIAAININLNAGTSQENIPNENSAAHFMEHMMFTDTDKRTAKSIWDAASYNGVTLNAFTNIDNVSFHINGPSENIINNCNILSSLLDVDNFKESEIEKQRSIILSEKSRSKDNTSYPYEKLFTELYHGSPYGRSVLGKESDIENISKNDLLSFKNRLYNKDNITISICGGISVDDVQNKIVPVFSSVFKDSKSDIKSINLDDYKYTSSTTYIKRTGNNNVVAFGRPLLHKINSFKDFKILNVIQRILGGPMSSKLNQKIREELGLVYQILFDIETVGKDNACWIVYYQSTNDNTIKVYDESINIIKDTLMNNDITDNEFQMAINSLKKALIVDDDNIEYTAYRMYDQLYRYNRIIPIEEVLEEVNSITKDDIRETMDKYISINDLSIAYSGNKEIF